MPLRNFDRRQIQHAAGKWGIPANVLAGLTQIESNFTAGAKSGAGARGKTQFMPGTARSYGVKFGGSRRAVASQYEGAAHYLHDLGYKRNPRKALASYNAGPGNYRAGLGYASNVLAASKRYKHLGTSSGGGDSLGSAGGMSVSVTPGQVEPGNAAIVDLLNPPKPVQPSGMDIPEPSFSAHNKLPVPAGYQAPPAVGAPVQPSSLSDQLRAIQQIPGTEVPKTTINVTGTPGSPGGGAVGGGRGKVIGHPLDRAGVSTRPKTIRFVQRVAGVYGHPIRLGTGTAHNRMTVNGNVSDHWSGHALDLPATGAKLIRMGQAALIAAGAKPSWARKQHGGLFNIGGHQVIFNTQAGGDHTTHLHVSA